MIKADEIVSTYELSSPDYCVPMGRTAFYNEQVARHKQSLKPNRAVAIVDILLFDTTGELFVQKRSNTKRHNSGLLDKSIGGHVQFGDDPNFTVMVETVQELQVPSIALYTNEDFAKTFILLQSYLETVAVLKHIKTFIDIFQKDIDGVSIPVSSKKHLYLGVYNGATKTVDRESKGVLLYDLADLRQEMKQNPERFTFDLHYYLEHYGKEIDAFIKNDIRLKK